MSSINNLHQLLHDYSLETIATEYQDMNEKYHMKKIFNPSVSFEKFILVDTFLVTTNYRNHNSREFFIRAVLKVS